MAGLERLLWSASAEEDLFSIWRYGAREWSTIRADEHVRALSHACERLLRAPELGRPREELITGLRSITEDPHVVFYRVSGRTIEIVRVLHQHEDVETVFQ
jgi:toxin ParE1/3/4